MKIIGLTGGIGSGKTIVSEVFLKLGIPVYNSDIQAKLLMNSDDEIINGLKELFGKEIYFKSGSLNREKLAEHIFIDKFKLQLVNNIVHPAVRKNFKYWINLQKSSYVIKETAILFESGTYKDTDLIISVFAPEELRIKRIIERDNLSIDEIRNRISNQISEAEKIRKSDFIIYNDDEKPVIPQILKINDFMLNNYCS